MISTNQKPAFLQMGKNSQNLKLLIGLFRFANSIEKYSKLKNEIIKKQNRGFLRTKILKQHDFLDEFIIYFYKFFTTDLVRPWYQNLK